MCQRSIFQSFDSVQNEAFNEYHVGAFNRVRLILFFLGFTLLWQKAANTHKQSGIGLCNQRFKWHRKLWKWPEYPRTAAHFSYFYLTKNGQLTADVIGQGGSWPTGERLGMRTSKTDLLRFLVYLWEDPFLWYWSEPLQEWRFLWPTTMHGWLNFCS